MLDSISIFTDTTQDLPSANVAPAQEIEQGDDLGERLYDYATSNESAAGFEDRFLGTNTEQLTRDQLEAGLMMAKIASFKVHLGLLITIWPTWMSVRT